MFFHETIDVFVFLLNEPQTCLELFDCRSLLVLIVKFHQVFADIESKAKHLLIIVFQLFLDALFRGYSEQSLLPSHNQLLPCEFQLVNIKLIPLEED